MSTKKNTKNKNEKADKLEKHIEILEQNIDILDKQKALEERVNEKKSAIKEDLQNQLVAQNKFGKQFDDMIEDYLYFVELKERLQYDLDVNGIRYKTTGGNGFTSYKPNESCERLIKTNAQMLKILQELDLKTPEEGPGEGEGDDLLS